MQTIDHELPPSWRRLKVGDVCKLEGGFAFKSKEYKTEGIPVVRISNVKAGGLDWRSKVYWSEQLEPELERYLLRRGDVLISMTGNIGETCRVRESDLPALLNQRVGRFASNGSELISSEFLLFASKTDEFRGRVSGNAYGAVQQNVSGKGIEAVEFSVPPLPEQQKIAAVLGVVQRGIEQQERLLQLTAELKKTLLHRLFTQGLRGEPQKQTEIGPVPESWEIVLLSDGVSIKKGQVDPKVTPFREMIHVGPENIESHTGRLLNLRSNSEQRISSGNYHFMNDDILYSKIRPYLNKVAIPNFEGTCSADMYPLRPKDGQFVRGFLFQLLLSDAFNKQAVSHQDRTGIPKINRVQLGSVLLPKPLLSEQVDIAESLALIDQRIDQLRRKHVALSDLFRTLLRQLMTAQIRVHDLDLPKLETATQR